MLVFGIIVKQPFFFVGKSCDINNVCSLIKMPEKQCVSKFV